MKKVNVNIIDLMAAAFIVILVLLTVFTLTNKPKISGQPTLLTVEVSNGANTIYSEAQKLGQVYLNSLNTPATAVTVARINTNKIDITILGTGTLNSDRYVFDGTRVLIGQKAELHGNYFAQGVVSAIRYEK